MTDLADRESEDVDESMIDPDFGCPSNARYGSRRTPLRAASRGAFRIDVRPPASVACVRRTSAALSATARSCSATSRVSAADLVRRSCSGAVAHDGCTAISTGSQTCPWMALPDGRRRDAHDQRIVHPVEIGPGVTIRGNRAADAVGPRDRAERGNGTRRPASSPAVRAGNSAPSSCVLVPMTSVPVRRENRTR